MANPWVDKAYARGAWPDAAKITDTRLDQMLDAAYELCAPYAVRLPTDAPEPEILGRWKEAVILAARGVWTAGRATADGLGLNDGSDLSLPQPVMSSQIYQLLRPPAPVVLG